MDLEKLTPADEWKTILPQKATGGWYCVGPIRETREQANADRDFNGLARAAFDVMMRRGWTARKSVGGSMWLVQIHPTTELLFHCKHPEWFSGSDPYTALVAADRWYKEHVEK